MANGRQAKPVKQDNEWEVLPSADEWEALPSEEELSARTQRQEPIYDRVPRAFLRGAGLPETLGDVPAWAWRMLGQEPGQPFKLGSPLDVFRPVTEPIKEAFRHPSSESIAGAVPFIGPSFVEASRQFQEGRPAEGIATAAGAISPFVVASPGVRAGTASALGSAAETTGQLARFDNFLAERLRYPATARQSQLGRPGTVKNILPPFLQKYTIPEGLIPKGELGTPTRPGPFIEIPARMPKPTSTAVVRTSPFEGMTPTAGAQYSEAINPFASELPQPSAITPSPPAFVEKFTPPTKPRIVSPGSVPPDIKVTYQSIPQPELRMKVMQGDTEAIREWQRRGLELPPNVRFLTEEAGTRPWRNYRR